MKTVAVYEAKTQFSKLIDEIVAGEEVTITRRGEPVVVMHRAETTPELAEVKRIIEAIKALRKGIKLPPGMTVRDMIEDGRRY